MYLYACVIAVKYQLFIVRRDFYFKITTIYLLINATLHSDNAKVAFQVIDFICVQSRDEHVLSLGPYFQGYTLGESCFGIQICSLCQTKTKQKRETTKNSS